MKPYERNSLDYFREELNKKQQIINQMETMVCELLNKYEPSHEFLKLAKQRDEILMTLNALSSDLEVKK